VMLTNRIKAIRHGVTIKWIIDFTRLYSSPMSRNPYGQIIRTVLSQICFFESLGVCKPLQRHLNYGPLGHALVSRAFRCDRYAR
jgi:hypothetical protein